VVLLNIQLKSLGSYAVSFTEQFPTFRGLVLPSEHQFKFTPNIPEKLEFSPKGYVQNMSLKQVIGEIKI
jgi:hypothetical protein